MQVGGWSRLPPRNAGGWGDLGGCGGMIQKGLLQKGLLQKGLIQKGLIQKGLRQKGSFPDSRKSG